MEFPECRVALSDLAENGLKCTTPAKENKVGKYNKYIHCFRKKTNNVKKESERGGHCKKEKHNHRTS